MQFVKNDKEIQSQINQELRKFNELKSDFYSELGGIPVQDQTDLMAIKHRELIPFFEIRDLDPAVKSVHKHFKNFMRVLRFSIFYSGENSFKIVEFTHEFMRRYYKEF